MLLRWLKADNPDIVCLQELKTTDDKFPRRELEKAGYGAVWHGQKSWNGVAILAKEQEPHLTRKGLPGDPDDSHARHIEAAVDGVLFGGLYLQNGNPAPGPKFDYKIAWFRTLHDYAAQLLELEIPVVLAGDYNVMPTDLDVYKPERWRDDALFRPEVRKAYADLVAQGWTDGIGFVPEWTQDLPNSGFELKNVRGVDFKIGLSVAWNREDPTAAHDDIIDIARSLVRAGR